MEPEKVFIFYSEHKQPEILDFYAEGIAYLKESEIDTDIVDIDEDKETAREHDVITTPTIIVKTNNETYSYLGLVDGMMHVLMQDAYGMSVLHEIGFREGKETVDRFADDEDVRDDVADAVTELDVESADITTFDRDAQTVELALTPGADEEQLDGVHTYIKAFLNGLFSKLFDTSITIDEKTCVLEGDDQCSMVITGDDEK